MRLSSVAVAAGSALLRAAAPLQWWIARPRRTHAYINARALAVLAADGQAGVSRLLQPFAVDMERGSIWADAGWRNVTHMFDPCRRCGLWRWPDATAVCEEHFERAVKEWSAGAHASGAFWLGAAVHVVQDLCVPHHASPRLLDGHRRFEALAESVRDRYAVSRSGMYGRADTAAGWVHRNAEAAQEYLPMALAGARPEQVERAIGTLLPLAQRTTAGFLAFFADRVGGT